MSFGHGSAPHEAWAVATHSLRKRFGRETALADVDLRVPDGAVYVLVGTNGSGKTTLLKVLMNLERPDSGTADVFGFDTAERGPEARAQIGYVPERHDAGYRWMTCAQLLSHVAAFFPSWDDRYRDHLAGLLALRLDRKVGSLSKGEARRLQLVTALAHRPPLVLLDEPTDGLDPVVRKRVLTVLAEHLADTPTTMLVTTHHIQEVESLADHVGVLSRGSLVAQLSIDELHRTVRRFRVALPESWELPVGIAVVNARRSRDGREAQWTVIGDERQVTARLESAGAEVRDVGSLSLEDAALALLSNEGEQ